MFLFHDEKTNARFKLNFERKKSHNYEKNKLRTARKSHNSVYILQYIFSSELWETKSELWDNYDFFFYSVTDKAE